MVAINSRHIPNYVLCNTELVSVCTFESTVEKTCLFSNDKSGLDNKDWIRHSVSAV